MVIEILIILFLILLNGFFSGSEIALISIKKSRLQVLMDEGDGRARLIQRLKDDPDNFFATVQIGVTLIGTLASAFGGSRLLGNLERLYGLSEIPLGIPYISLTASDAAFGGLVLAITYLTLVFGELIPKSLALNHAERFALIVAYPLHFVSKIFHAFTGLLTFSSNIILRLFKDQTSFSETKLIEEEIRQLLEEGVQAGTIEDHEHEIIQNVFEINDTAAREVMVPRVDVQAVPAELGDEEIQKIVDMPFSRIPVFKESLDHIVGILHVKDLFRYVARGRQVQPGELVRPAYFVPESMKIDKIMKEMQKRRTHMAIVVDEYGGTAGLLTMEDLLEEIVGEIQDVTEDPEPQEIVQVAEDTFLVAGSCPIADFNEFFKEHQLPESDSYNSLAGFVIEKIGRFPEVGEKLKIDNLVMELNKRVRQKLVQFRVVRRPPPSEKEAEKNGKNGKNGKAEEKS